MVRISSENDERLSCRGAPGDGRSAGEPLLSPWRLITGMGFIGGGAILRVRDSVRGTATAASLWATGALGRAVGLGVHDVAVILSIAAFITLKALTPLKRDTRAIDEVPTDPRD